MKTRLTQKYIDAIIPKEKPFEIRDEEVGGLLLRVQPTGSKVYYADFKLADGRRSRFKLGKSDALTVKNARDGAREVIADAQKGEDPAAKRKALRATRRAHTLESFLDSEFAPWAETHRKRGNELIDRVKWAFPSLLSLPLTDISAAKVEKVRSGRLKRGLQPATLNRDISALKGVLSRAVEWGQLKEHPLKTVKFQRLDSNGRIRFLSPVERKHLFNALDKREERIRKQRDSHNKWLEDRKHPLLRDLRNVPFADYLKPIVLTALHTGMRQGEIFSLCWDHVALARNVLTVAGETAKGGKSRTIPLNSSIAEVLRNWQKQTSKEGLVFPNPKTGKRLDNIKKSWKALVRDAEIDDFRFHDLRHTFASELVQRGVDLTVVRELLGHSNWQMTLRYSHLSPKHTADAVKKLIEADSDAAMAEESADDDDSGSDGS